MPGTAAVCGCDAVPPDMLPLEGQDHSTHLYFVLHAQAYTTDAGNETCTPFVVVSTVIHDRRTPYHYRLALALDIFVTVPISVHLQQWCRDPVQ